MFTALASFMDLSIRANTKPTADIIGSMKQLSVVLHMWRLSPLPLVAAPHRGDQILCPLVPISSMHVLRGGAEGAVVRDTPGPHSHPQSPLTYYS